MKEDSSAMKKEILSWILSIGIPVAVVLFLNTFICQLVWVDGNSMYPTLHDHDLMLVRKIAYEPRQGDIVVLYADPDSILNGERIVKRIIGVSGQSVEIDTDANTVTVDGVTLEEPYLNDAEADCLQGSTQTGITVPEDSVFVMGDNRNHSTDSRVLGSISTENVMGKAILTIPSGKLYSMFRKG